MNATLSRDPLDVFWRSLPMESRAALTASITAEDTAVASVPPPAPAPAVVTAATSAEVDDRELLERAVHEAGHAVAAVALGGRISHGYVLPAGRSRDGLFGRVTMAEMPVGDLRGQIAYAGPWAQARFRSGGGWPTPHQMHEVMSTAGQQDRKHLCASVSGDGREVVGLMDRCWPAVIALAKNLVHDGEIRHEHVVAALGLSDDATRQPFELASIRAGLRGVPT